MSEINNKQTLIEELQSTIAEAVKSNVSREELSTLENRFMDALKQREKEMPDADAMFSKFQTSMETKMAELQASIRKNEFDANAGSTNGSFGEFLVKARNHDAELAAFTRKALSEGTGTAGGYLVPVEYSNEITRIALENSVVRANGARVINMNRSSLKVPGLNMSSNASGSLFGGIATYWAGEAASITASAPAFTQISLDAKKISAYVASSDELENDAIASIGGLLQTMFAEALAFETDAAFLTGAGTSAVPQGVIGATATITVGRAATGSVGTSDLIGMLARFLRKGGSPVWVVNQTVLPSLYKLKDENNNYILLPGNAGSIATGFQGTIYGVPVVVTEKSPALGTAGDVLLADFRYYLIGDRQSITVAESMDYLFQTGQKAWRVDQRVDGRPWLESAVTPRAGGSTLSPFVKLGNYGA